uniref:DNA polymerase III subunit epsilon n=1 Tax=Peronospora matthiolae TaxID=2874970 RepID=A0AAV1UTZ9_9STRA
MSIKVLYVETSAVQCEEGTIDVIIAALEVDVTVDRKRDVQMESLAHFH